MPTRAVWKITAYLIAPVLIVITLTVVYRNKMRRQQPEPTNITGVVLIDDADTNKQRPIALVKVQAPGSPPVITDAAGLFHLRLPPALGSINVTLSLEHPDYVPLTSTVENDGELYVLRMKPLAAAAAPVTPEVPVADVRVRYTESTTSSFDTGSALKSFQVVNKGNVPCNGRQPCSPDGKWKAAIGGASLDAGEGNEFREARVSCVAGPCPFTAIEKDSFSSGGRNISVTVRDWSDTVSFVLEAEVIHTAMSDKVRISYPLIFGRGMNFTLPPTGEGLSLIATVAGSEIVFPLGPGLNVSWAICSVQRAQDLTKSYRCDLKPGYRFQNPS
jgi:hypothetical protein